MAKQTHDFAGVSIEWDDTNHPKLNARHEAWNKAIPKSKNNDDDFTPTRIIVNLKMDLGSPTTGNLKLENVRLTVPYHSSGLSSRLGWWNGSKWVEFTKSQIQHNNAEKKSVITLPKDWPADPPIGGNP